LALKLVPLPDELLESRDCATTLLNESGYEEF
jgi:hypothetical protein